MFARLLIVCVGNICRSPMAEAILAHRLARRGVKVESAGIAALVGHPADPAAQALMQERGLDLGFDLILVMEAGQQRAVEAIEPTARGRVHRLGRWGGFDVPDPYRQDRAAFGRALSLIDRGVEDLVKTFWKGIA
jgi:protein-tyrosine phosphatase